MWGTPSRLSIALVLVLACTACAAERDSDGDESNAEAGSAAASGVGGAGGGGGELAGAGGDVDASGAGGAGGVMVSGGTGGAVAAMDASVELDASVEDASSASDSAIEAGVGPLPDQSCLEGIADYVAAGPFSFETATVGAVKVWLPQVPEGCKLPVVHFANGTGASCSNYTGALEHLASHGFLTACFESPQTGEGTQCIEAVEAVYDAYPELASTQQIGFTGNGTGGSSALACTARAENKWGATKILAGHALPPDLAGAVPQWQQVFNQIDSPVFIVNGSVGGQPTDGLVSEAWVRDVYEAFNSSVEAYWYEGVEAQHIPVPIDFIEESSVAWFRWKLLGDSAACAYFKAMPDGARWNLQEQQNAVDCD